MKKPISNILLNRDKPVEKQETPIMVYVDTVTAERFKIKLKKNNLKIREFIERTIEAWLQER